MVNFEDGTLIEGAYVLIDGVKYPVVMPQYSGNTPLNSENMNKLQNDLKKEIENNIENLIETMKEVLLFESEQGVSSGTINLNDTIYNYERIKIVYGNIEDIQFLELDTNNGKLNTIHLLKGYLATETIYQMQTADLSCTGNTMTFQNNMYENIQHNDSSIVSEAEYVKVFKVFGINKKTEQEEN